MSAFSGISSTRAGAAAGGGGGTLEQQRLERERLRREEEEKQKRDVELHFGAEEFWERHSGMNTPTIITTDTYAPVPLVFLVAFRLIPGVGLFWVYAGCLRDCGDVLGRRAARLI